MAGTNNRLTNHQRVRLSQSLTLQAMKSIGIGYLNLSDITIKNLETENKGDVEAFIRSVIAKWENVTSGGVLELAVLLHRAAKEGGYMQSSKVKEILGISKEEAQAVQKQEPEHFDEEVSEDDYLENEKIQHVIGQLKKASCELGLEMAGMTDLYTLDYDKLKTRLLVSKLADKNTIQEYTHYKEIFADFCDKSPHVVMRLQFQGRKILVKGSNGMGKSLLAKNMVLDWAKGQFSTFQVVFFVDLTLVKPGETIDHIIDEQSGLLREDVDKLKRLKSQSLVVIDGLEDRGMLDDVLKYVRPYGRNVLVTTSDYHLANSIEIYFDTVGTLQGLSEEDIISSMSTELNAKSVRDIEVSFRSVFMSSLENNPMLTTFKVILVKHNKLEPRTKQISLCQVYFQLMRLLHGSSDDEGFVDFAKEMGILALDSLQFRKFSVKESSVPNWLITKSSNRIMSFANRSLETFLAALYFVGSIEDNEIHRVLNAASQDDVSKPILMVNPLFLYVCLALLQEKSLVSDSVASYDKMKEYVRQKIDLVQLDLLDISVTYPALNVSVPEDDPGSQFLFDVLKDCGRTQDLILVPGLPIKMILNAVASANLKMIQLGEETNILVDGALHQMSTDDLCVRVQGQAGEPLRQLFGFLDTVERPFALYFVATKNSAPMIDFNLFAKPNLKDLCINSSADNFQCDLITRCEIAVFPSLRSLQVVSEKIKLRGNIIDAFAKALGEGRFPVLSLCNINGANPSQLFQCPWPALNRLGLPDTGLHNNTANSICTEILPSLVWFEVDQNDSSVEDPDNISSKLSGMRLLSGQIDFQGIVKHFEAGNFKNLTKLELVQFSNFPKSFLDGLTAKTVHQLHELLLEGSSNSNLPETFSQNEVVTKLVCLSLKKFTFPEGLSSLFHENNGLSRMERLKLIDCKLSEQDVRCLAQTSVEGMLPKLKHLDLSENEQIDGSRYLFDLNCRWENLLSLNVECKEQRSYDGEEFGVFLHLTDKALSGCLGSLENLRFSTQNSDCLPKITRHCWPRLKVLKISSRSLDPKPILSQLSELVDMDDVLQSLESVTISFRVGKPQSSALERQKLRRKGVRVYCTTPSWYF